jgi:PAS domain S-box-containing protein
MFFHKKTNHSSHLHNEGLQSIVSDLRHSVAWMDLVFAHITESIVVITRDGSIKFANDAFASLVNEARILLLGQPLWKFMYLTNKEDTPLGAGMLAKAWSADTAKQLDGSYHFKDKVVELTTQYVEGVDQMILVIRDITGTQQTQYEIQEAMEHIRQEQAKLQENAAKDEAMLRSIGDAVIAADKDGNMMLMNTSAEQLFAVDSTKLIGKRVVETLKFYDEKDVLIPSNDRMLTRALRTGERQGSGEDVCGFYHLPNGTTIALALTITPVTLKGNIIGAIGIYRDVTHAREVDRMKTEFISLASHQLRTPLSAIKWFGEMLLSGDAGKLSDDQIDVAKNISQSTDRMIELVNSLLNISSIESGRIIINPEPTDLKELVTSVISELHELTEEKQQTLIVSVHDSLQKLTLDRRLIGQVYLDLLTNAIKYTPKGGEITIIISANGDDIVSQISDSGIGVPKAQQAKLFNKFFRAENAVKVETDGNGLGLYLIKAIVESSGGKVWFKSEEGKGSTFWFSVPKTGMKSREGDVMLETTLAKKQEKTRR